MKAHKPTKYEYLRHRFEISQTSPPWAPGVALVAVTVSIMQANTIKIVLCPSFFDTELVLPSVEVKPDLNQGVGSKWYIDDYRFAPTLLVAAVLPLLGSPCKKPYFLLPTGLDIALTTYRQRGCEAFAQVSRWLCEHLLVLQAARFHEACNSVATLSGPWLTGTSQVHSRKWTFQSILPNRSPIHLPIRTSS